MLHIRLAAYAETLKTRYSAGHAGMSESELAINEALEDLCNDIAEELESIVSEDADDARFNAGR